jgi:CheY-like chemotaxis protein
MASKVLLVEDDNNLREIYQARLQAEGYDIVSAKDGEEALVIAKQEQPDLIISDVMMPRVSGFEMLDILRNTEGLKDPKVIMLTALGQADDKNRADQLGADRYLVKSQVTLEDIVKAAQDLLNGTPAPEPVASSVVTDMPVTAAPADPPAVAAPVAPAPTAPSDTTDTTNDPVPVEPPATPEPTPEPPAPVEEAPIEPDATPAPTTPGTETVVTQPVEASPDENDPNDQLIADALKDLTAGATDEASDAPSDTTDTTNDPVPVEPPAAPEPTPEPADPPAPVPAPETIAAAVDDDNDSSPVAHKKVIRPISQPNAAQQPDINELLAKEEAKSDASVPVPAPEPVTVSAPEVQSDVSAPAPHQPGHVISPTPSAPAAPEPTPEPADPPAPVPAPETTSAPVAPTLQTPTGVDESDPNNIAL